MTTPGIQSGRRGPIDYAISPGSMMVHLRRCGIVVHRTARIPAPAHGRYVEVVVFLESALAQHDLAATCLRRLPGVLAVTFSGHNRAVMYVRVSPATDVGKADGTAESE